MLMLTLTMFKMQTFNNLMYPTKDKSCIFPFRPSTVILVIVGGMTFSGLAVNEITTVVLVSLVVAVYTLICLFTSQDFQLRVSKLLTFVFAVIMCIVFIGVAVQISKEIKSTDMPTLEPNSTDSDTSQSLEQQLPAGASTLYLAGLSGIFIAAALLHPNELTCLFHGIWYLLCLPSGYLLLTIYSLCNLTDRSWGKCAVHAPVVRKVNNAVHWINLKLPFSVNKTNRPIHWIVIYPVVIHLSNNQGHSFR